MAQKSWNVGDNGAGLPPRCCQQKERLRFVNGGLAQHVAFELRLTIATFLRSAPGNTSRRTEI